MDWVIDSRAKGFNHKDTKGTKGRGERDKSRSTGGRRLGMWPVVKTTGCSESKPAEAGFKIIFHKSTGFSRFEVFQAQNLFCADQRRSARRDLSSKRFRMICGACRVTGSPTVKISSVP